MQLTVQLGAAFRNSSAVSAILPTTSDALMALPLWRINSIKFKDFLIRSLVSEPENSPQVLCQ